MIYSFKDHFSEYVDHLWADGQMTKFYNLFFKLIGWSSEETLEKCFAEQYKSWVQDLYDLGDIDERTYKELMATTHYSNTIIPLKK